MTSRSLTDKIVRLLRATQRDGLRGIYKIAAARILTAIFELKKGGGIEVTEQDWDNLILLDACRLDEFRKLNGDSEQLHACVSQGRNSGEYLRENFYGKKLNDTIYVTANPHVDNIPDGVFFKIVDTPLKDHFDTEAGTVLPGFVTESAIRANRRYPEKRLIVHYMQPHMPPIGDVSGLIRDLRSGFDMTGQIGNSDRFYNMVEAGVVGHEDALNAYRQNLKLVMPEAIRLGKKLDGKSIISSDHGEYLGEYLFWLRKRKYSHGLTFSLLPKSEELCIVPWLEMECDRRRSVKSDRPVPTDRLSTKKAQEQLESLGYIQ